MTTEQDNKIGDMVFPVSLIMLADPLLSVCSSYAVRERFISGRTMFARRRMSSDVDSFAFKHCLENTFEDTYSMERALTTGDVWQ
jgi:hypothetical protein